MLIQEYAVYDGWNSILVAPTAQLMTVIEKWGSLYAYFMVLENDFGSLVEYQIEVCWSTGGVPDGSLYRGSVNFNGDVKHIFVREPDVG